MNLTIEERDIMMGSAEACYTVQLVAAERGEGLLETLQYMSENLDDFKPNERTAFRIFMSLGSQMFAEA